MERDFVIGVVGDFSGGSHTQPERFLEVDRDDFGELFARLKPHVELGLPFCERLELGDWDDWHPDGLVERVPTLAKLLEARDCAGDVSRMRERLAEAGVSIEAAASGEGAAPPAEAAEEVSESELLDDLLAGGGQRGGPVRVARHVADPEFERLVAEIAEPHAERIDHAGIAARRQAIDRELQARTRTLLRHPAFRARESLWRSLRALVWGSETGEQLRIRILDADPGALRSEGGRGLAEALERLVVTDASGTLGGQPFGLLILDVEVEGRDEDLALLTQVARIASAAPAPCLLGAGRALWDPDTADTAEAFLGRARALAGAERIGLCGPGLLARLPYGRDGDPVERFGFEEVDADTGPEGYCWGSAAFAVAGAAAEAVAALGDAGQAARFARREGLPFHPRGRDAEPVGPSRQVLPDAQLERLRGLGILPVAGVRGQDTAVILSLDSLTGAPLLRE